jgi:hypothetical protein
MTEPASIGFPAAARRLGVPLRVLRDAIHAGRVPAPPSVGATAALPLAWVQRVEAAAAASPTLLHRVFAQKVPPFARYDGTSAWRKYTNRVREYNHFRAKAG